MTVFAGKKLLILGGNQETSELVRAANALGIHSIVVDPNPQAPAKLPAAERYDVDGFDVDGIVEIARKCDVDGVLVGVADILVAPYHAVCERLGLPCYASKASVDAFCRKDGFRDACRRFGVTDIPGFLVDRNTTQDELPRMDYPVMVKPVDNGGGVGMRVCQDSHELGEAMDSALTHSRGGQVLIERYMLCDDLFAYYTFKDGQVFLSATADRIRTTKQEALSPVCLAAIYPSKHTSDFVNVAHPRLVDMFRRLGVRDGVLNIQFFAESGKFFAYDPGFRLQGEAPHVYLSAVNRIDQREMLLSFALTGSMGVPDFEQRNDHLLRGKHACTLWVLLDEGKIGTIEGLELIRQAPNVVAVLQRLRVGDLVTPEMLGTERQVMARIYVVADTVDELADTVAGIHTALQVTDEAGSDMLIDRLEPALIRSR